jgi:uncharacterized membrane protein (DUF485 family)
MSQPAVPPGEPPPQRRHQPTREEFVEAADSPEFAQLRKNFRGFAFPMTVAFLVWYFLFVLMSVYARGFMSIKVIGNVNIGIFFGFAQFLTTFLLTWLYIRHANKNLDPLATRIRSRLEDQV